jgi:hypothetical protein
LSYTPREAVAPALVNGPSVDLLTTAGPVRVAGTAGGAVPGDTEKSQRQSVTQARQAVFGAVVEVSVSTRRISSELSRLKANKDGIAGKYAVLFMPYVDSGVQQLRWIDASLQGATMLASAASEVDDLEMELAMLRLTGPRLQAAMLGSILLAAWLDFLNLTDVVLDHHHFYGKETLFVDMRRLQKMIEPAMKALSSLEPEQIEAAATDLPALMNHLSGEFNSTCESVRL